MKFKSFLFLAGLLLVMGYAHGQASPSKKKNSAQQAGRPDSLKNKKSSHVPGDFEKDEYPVYVDDMYNTFCERRLLNKIVDGYTDKLSYNPGDTVKLYLNTSNANPQHTLYLLDVLLHKQDSLVASTYPQFSSFVKPWENYGYIVTCTYVIPQNLASGLYNFGNAVFFMVKSASKNADITIVYPSNTEGAYNNAGGKSLYDFNSTDNQKVTCVTFQRPLSNFILKEIQQHSYPFLKWLKKLNGYSIQYIQDVDMEHYSEIANTKLLVVIGHSEYWTRQGRINFDRFVNYGHDAAILSGNTMCWQIRYEAGDKKMVCHKLKHSDSTAAAPLKTILWTDTSLNYPVLKSIGCDWTNGAYGMHLNYHGNYGYTILLPNSPLLEGTGIGFHGFLSCQSYEYDATLFSGFDANLDPVVDSAALGFCKIELLGYDIGNSTSNTPYVPKGFGTFVVFKKMPASGIVVNAGFNTFTGKTPSYGSGGICGPDSVNIRKLTLNIFSKLLNHDNVFANPNICAANGIQENNFNRSFNTLLLYPNPGKNEFTINTNLQENLDNPKIELYDCFGTPVFSKTLEKEKFNKLNLSHLEAGTYLYILYNGNSIITRSKLIIMR